MCGRFTLRTNASRVAEAFGLDVVPDIVSRYNIAPTQSIAVVRLSGDGELRPRLSLVRWGLIPFWAKDPSIGARTINARSETVAERPTFRDSFRKRRCLVAADGFYEWKAAGKKKQPYYIHFADDRPFAFAGLWDRWKPADGEPIESCTILTTSASKSLASLHERMPVILRPEDHLAWLDGSKGLELLAPNESEEIIATPVSTEVNNVRNHSPKCVEPVNLDGG